MTIWALFLFFLCMMASLKFSFPVPFPFLQLYTSLNIKHFYSGNPLILLQYYSEPAFCDYSSNLLSFCQWFSQYVYTLSGLFIKPEVLYSHKVLILDLVSPFFLITIRSSTELTIITSSSCSKYHTKIL